MCHSLQLLCPLSAVFSDDSHGDEAEFSDALSISSHMYSTLWMWGIFRAQSSKDPLLGLCLAARGGVADTVLGGWVEADATVF